MNNLKLIRPFLARPHIELFGIHELQMDDGPGRTRIAAFQVCILQALSLPVQPYKQYISCSYITRQNLRMLFVYMPAVHK